MERFKTSGPTQRTVTSTVVLAEIRVKGPVYLQAEIFAVPQSGGAGAEITWIEAKKEDLTWIIRDAMENGFDGEFIIWREDGGLYLMPHT